MTLQEAQVMLDKNNISYQLCEFFNEAEYLHHISMFPYTKKAKSCKVIAIVIPSNNGHKNIELQFNLNSDIPQFVELWFGSYTYEAFDYGEDCLKEELLHHISEIMQGNLKFIVVYDLKKKWWLGDACFDLTDDDSFGNPGFQKVMQKIQKKKGLWAKLMQTQKQYEIYDWNRYQSIIK